MKKIERVNVSDNEFKITVDGDPKYKCERELLKNGARGFWLLMEHTPIGPLIIDRDQYSNDLIAHVGAIENSEDAERNFKRYRCRIVCHSREQFNQNIKEWITKIQDHFGGEWTAEYDDWRRWAVFEVL